MALPTAPVPGEGSTTAIISWFLLVVSAFAVFTRLATKWAIRRTLNLDDALAVAALFSNVGSSIAVHVQAMHGLGYSLELFSSNDVIIFMKASYALGLTYIPTLCFAKLSIVALLLLITPSQIHHRIAYAIAACIGLGAVASELAAALQCHGPHPWDIRSGKCYASAPFWRFVSIFNILTDCSLIAMPLLIIVPIQMSTRRKLLLLISFSSRFFDVGASAVQLFFTSAFASSDISRHIWKWVLLAQLTQCISIVTSCVPYLRPLLETLPTGMFLSDELRRRGLDATYIKSQELTKELGKTRTSSARVSTMSPTKRNSSFFPKEADIPEFLDHGSVENGVSDGMSLNSRSNIIPIEAQGH